MIKLNTLSDIEKVANAVTHNGLALVLGNDQVGRELIFTNSRGVPSALNLQTGVESNYRNRGHFVEDLVTKVSFVTHSLRELGLSELSSYAYEHNGFKKTGMIIVPQDVKDLLDAIMRGKLNIQMEVRHAEYTVVYLGNHRFSFTTKIGGGSSTETATYLQLFAWVWQVRRNLRLRMWVRRSKP